ncbi:cilia- and flagella-associated protein 251-like [Prorops nasuta]|uniref:cilia- and flagella-associated protein 251-like n=1 Tax=Prorops nasuta TaxID=863751 RepID=UPI0034CD4292
MSKDSSSNGSPINHEENSRGSPKKGYWESISQKVEIQEIRAKREPRENQEIQGSRREAFAMNSEERVIRDGKMYEEAEDTKRPWQTEVIETNKENVKILESRVQHEDYRGEHKNIGVTPRQDQDVEESSVIRETGKTEEDRENEEIQESRKKASTVNLEERMRKNTNMFEEAEDTKRPRETKVIETNQENVEILEPRVQQENYRGEHKKTGMTPRQNHDIKDSRIIHETGETEEDREIREIMSNEKFRETMIIIGQIEEDPRVRGTWEDLDVQEPVEIRGSLEIQGMREDWWEQEFQQGSRVAEESAVDIQEFREIDETPARIDSIELESNRNSLVISVQPDSLNHDYRLENRSLPIGNLHWTATLGSNISALSGTRLLANVEQLEIQQIVDLSSLLSKSENGKQYRVKVPGSETIFLAMEDRSETKTGCINYIDYFKLNITDQSGQTAFAVHKNATVKYSPTTLHRIGVISRDSVGTVEQNFSILNPSFTVYDQLRREVAYIYGVSSFCISQDSHFKVLSPDGSHQIASIMHQYNINLHDYTVLLTFPVDTNVQVKSLLLGASFLMEYLYFDRIRQKTGY